MWPDRTRLVGVLRPRLNEQPLFSLGSKRAFRSGGHDPDMNRLRRFPLVLVAVAVVGGCNATVAGGSPAAASPSVGSTANASPAVTSVAAGAQQTNDGGGVTLMATWAGPSAGAAFTVSLDTHSVDLDGLDLAAATLRNDRGEQLTGGAWDAPKGGHHRTGTLRFAGDAVALLARATWIELLVPGVGGVPERVLRWQVGT